MINYIILVLSASTAVFTHLLHVRFKQGPVRASALLALVAGLIFHFFPTWLSADLSKHIPLVVIGASFIGMVSSDRLANILGIIIAGLLFGLIYAHTSRYFDGYGGALGTAACIAVLVCMAIPHLSSKRKLTVGILQLRRMLFNSKRKTNYRRRNQGM